MPNGKGPMGGFRPNSTRQILLSYNLAEVKFCFVVLQPWGVTMSFAYFIQNFDLGSSRILRRRYIIEALAF
jgi:hypothetical protein